MQQDASVFAQHTSQESAVDSGQPILEVKDLEVSFGEGPVLHGVNFTIRRGERVAIVGQSGSGKSTTVGAILGLLPGNGRITGGSITLDGADLGGASEKQLRHIRGRQIGLVPQDPMSNLNPVMKVGAQIADALAANGHQGRDNIRQRAVNLMTEAGIPDAGRRYGQFPHEFSGGMRQRVLIAISLAGEPELLIADEPTSALDVTVQRQILDHLQTLVDARGTSLLFITHDLGLAADRTDRIIVMANGHIVEVGTPEQILLNPQEEYTQQLVAAAPSLLATVTGEELAGASLPVESKAASTTILEVRGLVKEFTLRSQHGKKFLAVDNVSFSVERGTTTAVVGESGSGKTTIARMILGLEQATSGEALIDGKSITASDGAVRRALRRKVQPVFQDPYGSLNPTFSIERLIDEPLRVFKVGNAASRRARVAQLLDQVALPRTMAQRRPNELSGGQRQRVAIARALALEPEMLICDEAVSALDVLVQDQILDLLAELQNRLGLTYLFITHDLAVVRQIAHQVVVMKAGKVVEDGSVEKVFMAPEADYTKELLGAIPGASFAR
ncbi:dipeptide ABC transporter ATP-binding protein [Arthrobacter cryoconiti]|uniref:Dipeptide ABC transporter ATP-binding protein n=1 Tax=Arthrobacter cryoconiti TaxID=748907 RepID=A0ABV8QZK0_9MICC|nr:ABC transporter ATP-binding protein [Arthrobacter cryoconiti]MCC9068638.1 ABC transporter ATP-binding protein [Arthrobacter cryoconiti]